MRQEFKEGGWECMINNAKNQKRNVLIKKNFVLVIWEILCRYLALNEWICSFLKTHVNLIVPVYQTLWTHLKRKTQIKEALMQWFFSRSLKAMTFNYCSIYDFYIFWYKKEQNVCINTNFIWHLKGDHSKAKSQVGSESLSN